jgi:hypothetical protein
MKANKIFNDKDIEIIDGSSRSYLYDKNHHSSNLIRIRTYVACIKNNNCFTPDFTYTFFNNKVVSKKYYDFYKKYHTVVYVINKRRTRRILSRV